MSSTTSESPGCTRCHGMRSRAASPSAARYGWRRADVARIEESAPDAAIRTPTPRRRHDRRADATARTVRQSPPRCARYGTTVVAPRIAAEPAASCVDEDPPAARVRSASASPCPTSIMCSSVGRARAWQHAARARARATRARRRSKRAAAARETHAAMSAIERRAAAIAPSARGQTRAVRRRGRAPRRARRRRTRRSARAPRRRRDDSTPRNGMAIATKSSGCSKPITGSASRLVTGPSERDTAERPCDERRGHARRDDAHDAAGRQRAALAAATCSGTIRRAERTAGDERRGAGDAELPAQIDARVRGSDEGPTPPSARIAHARRGSLAQAAVTSRRRASRRRARRAVARRSQRRRQRRIRQRRDARRRDAAIACGTPSSSSASAMIPTCSPDTLSMCTSPARAYRSRCSHRNGAHVGDDRARAPSARRRRRSGRCGHRPRPRTQEHGARVGRIETDVRLMKSRSRVAGWLAADAHTVARRAHPLDTMSVARAAHPSAHQQSRARRRPRGGGLETAVPTRGSDARCAMQRSFGYGVGSSATSTAPAANGAHGGRCAPSGVDEPEPQRGRALQPRGAHPHFRSARTDEQSAAYTSTDQATRGIPQCRSRPPSYVTDFVLGASIAAWHGILHVALELAEVFFGSTNGLN